MPWSIQQRDGKWCVVKKGENTPVPGGCHDSRVDAIKHQRALYANEPVQGSAEWYDRQATLNVIEHMRELAAAGGFDLDALGLPHDVEALTAAAGFPLRPPRNFFETPEPDGPRPLLIGADGRVSGHLAPWNGCHTSFGQCLTPPRSPDGYQMFHTGVIETLEGDMINVGKIVFNGKHAPLDMGLAAATQHYDDNGHVGAYVRATDGRHGIWLSGAVKHDISPEGLRDLRANPPSGDWRQRNGRFTLVAALAVPVPGYPIGRAASAEQSEGLILSFTEEEPVETETRSKEYLRQRAVVAAGLAVATPSTKPRNKEYLRKRALIASALGRYPKIGERAK